MKLKSVFALTLYALMAAVPISAVAAPDADTNATKAADPKVVTPHSHLTEKTGIAPKLPIAAPAGVRADLDKTRHFHPRDGK